MTDTADGLPADPAARAQLAADLAATHAQVFPAPQIWASDDFTGLFATRGILLTGGADSFVLGRILFDEAEILTLATHPAHQRKGLARARLAAFETAAAQAGATRVFLEVSVHNIPASALYAAAGYTQIGRRSGYYAESDGTRADALVLSKSVGG